MGLLRNAVTFVVLALLAPYIYDRAQVLKLFYQNAPVRLPKVNQLPNSEVKFADRIRSCEDALLIEDAGIAILPCDPGRERWNSVMGFFLPGPVVSGELYLYDYKDVATPDAEALKRVKLLEYAPGDDFHPLGMAYDEATATLFVANNRHDGPAVDLFHLDRDSLQARHIRTVKHPLVHGPNAIVLRNSHEFFVSNDHYFLMAKSRFLSQVETYLALPLGTVVHVDISDPNTAKAAVVARTAFPNGVEIINETTLVVASTSKAQLRFYDIVDGPVPTAAPSLDFKSAIRMPFSVDNLSITSDGRLLISGHPHVPSLVKYAGTRWICNDAAELARADANMQGYCKTAQSPSWVSEWTENGGLKHLYSGTEFPSSTTAAYDAVHKVGIVSSLYGKGVLVWRG